MSKRMTDERLQKMCEASGLENARHYDVWTVWAADRIRELEAKLGRVREIRQNVKGGIEASAGLDDEIGVYWQELFLDMIDKALADD